MRELTTGTNKHTTVVAVDEPSYGGACHKYQVFPVGTKKPLSHEEAFHLCLAQIHFQEGPVKEHGVNGIHEQDLLCIVLDRLEGWQSGELACVENEGAIKCLESAITILANRTKRRELAGIEGTSKKDPTGLEGKTPEDPMCEGVQAKADEYKAAHFEEDCMRKSAVKVFDGFTFACTGCENLGGDRKTSVFCKIPECDKKTKLDNSVGEVKEYVPPTTAPSLGSAGKAD